MLRTRPFNVFTYLHFSFKLTTKNQFKQKMQVSTITSDISELEDKLKRVVALLDANSYTRRRHNNCPVAVIFGLFCDCLGAVSLHSTHQGIFFCCNGPGKQCFELRLRAVTISELKTFCTIKCRVAQETVRASSDLLFWQVPFPEIRELPFRQTRSFCRLCPRTYLSRVLNANEEITFCGRCGTGYRYCLNNN